MDIRAILDFSIGSFTVGRLLYAIVLLVVSLILVRLIMSLLRKVLGKTHLETGIRSFTLSLAKVLLYFVAVLIICTSLGIDVTSLLAVFSIAGLAASLAMQDTLSNLASGVLVLVSKPFKVGDFVECGANSGIVQKVSLVYTTVMTLDNRLVYIPNKDIASARVTNYSHEALRRVDLTFTASYDIPTNTVKEALLHAAAQVPTALAEPAPFTSINAYNGSNIEYVLRVWTNNADYWDTHFGLMEQVRESYAKFGVTMTYDHVNVHIVEK